MDKNILAAPAYGQMGIFSNPEDDAAARHDGNQQPVDLNKQLIRNSAATFLMRVNSDVMAGAGIHCGDVVVVDRSLEPRNGAMVIAAVDGERLIRRLEISNGKYRLVPGCSSLSPIDLGFSGFRVWGVVTFVIRSL